MFDFEAALKVVQEERAAKAAAEARRLEYIRQRIVDLHIPLQKFIDEKQLTVSAVRKDDGLIVTKRKSGQVEVTANDEGLYSVESRGDVYTGRKMDYSDLNDDGITKVLVAWMTADSGA